MSTTTRAQFAFELLGALGIEPNAQNINGLVSAMVAENCSASFNPLATTEPWAGDSNYNSAGVRNYATLQDGIDATKATLTNGLYNPVLTALRGGTANIIAQAWVRSPWGTEPFSPISMTDEAQYNVDVGGSEATPEPVIPPPVEPPTPISVYWDIVGAPTLSQGQKGWDVAVLQRLLNAGGGFGLAIDGIFGAETETALRGYQSVHDLPVDGIAGLQTWSQLLT